MSFNGSKVENEIMDLINSIRTEPSSFIPILKAHLKNFKGKYYKIPDTNINIVTQEGPDAVLDAIKCLKEAPSVPPLNESMGLHLAARDHAMDIGASGRTSHEGGDGSKMSDRIDRYGKWDHSIAENISFDDERSVDIVLGMIVDDGNKSKRHRKNILNQDFRYSGIAFAKHAKHKFVTVIDFAMYYEEETELIEQRTQNHKDELYSHKALTKDDNEDSNFNRLEKRISLHGEEKQALAQDYEIQTKSNADLIKNQKESASLRENSVQNINKSQKRELVIENKDPKLIPQPLNNVYINSSPIIASMNFERFQNKAEGNANCPTTSTPENKPGEEEYDIDDDPDWPDGAVNVRVRRHTRISGSRKIVKTTKVYTMPNGDEEIVENME